MALTQLAPPYPIFTDKSGSPLDNGYLYFGEVNKNPETNPIQVYYDSAFTQPAAQPLRTSNGYVMRNGSPALIYADSQFSVTVRDKNNALVIYSPVGYGIDPASAVTGSVTVQDQTGDGTTVTFGMGASPNTKNATNVYIDGVYQEKDTYSISGTSITFSEAPPLNAGIEIVSQESPLIGGASASQTSYNEGSVGAVNTTVKAKLQETVSVKDFGAVGDGVTDDSDAIRSAISTGNMVYFPNGRYVYDGTVITNSVVRIQGEVMPTVNSAKTDLDNGAIILGTLAFSSDEVYLKDFGVKAPVDGDAIRASAKVLNSGGHLHTENLVGLCTSPSSDAHALLFQSFQKHTGGNLYGIYSKFGFVSKCQNVDLTTIHTVENDESGVILKSDTGFGTCGNVSIQQTRHICSSSQRRGFHIQSSDVTVRNVQIGEIYSDGAIDNVLVQCGSGATDIRNVQINSIISRNSQTSDFKIENLSSTAKIWDVQVGRLMTEGTQSKGIYINNSTGSSSVDDVQIQSAYISYEPTATQGTMDNSCFVGNTVKRFKIDNLTILRNFQTNAIGGITFASSDPTFLDNYVVKTHVANIFTGLRVGSDEVTLDSGSDVSVTVPKNIGGHFSSCLRVTPDSAADNINGFVVPVTGYKFPRGHMLTIINMSSTVDLDVLHNPSGNIYNKGDATKTLGSFEACSWVHSGGGVWHEVG